MPGHDCDGTTSGAAPWAWPFTVQTRQSGVRVSLLSGALLPFAFIVAATAALAVDCQLSQWCLGQSFPREITRLLNMGEMCSHGLGVLVIVIVMYQLDVTRRKFVPHVLVASLGAGIVANVLKLLVARTRPHSFDFQGDVWSTFTAAFPLLDGGSAGQSFPSAHVAVASGLAVVLGRLYPRAAWLFTVLAILAACQRIQGGAHFLSDVLVGAAVGLVFSRAILSTKMFLLSGANSNASA